MAKSDLQRRVVRLWRKGTLSVTEIAAKLQKSVPTISRALHRALESGKVTDAPRRGRPPVSSEADDQRLFEIVEANWDKPLAWIRRQWGVKCSLRTLRNRMRKKHSWPRGVAMRRTPIQERHRQPRVDWAKRHLQWSVREWSKVLWCDEKLWLLSNRGRVWIFRPAGEYQNPDFQIHERKIPGSIRTWACFGNGQRGAFAFYDGSMTADKYLDVLRKHAIPAARRLCGRWWWLQDDGDGAHRAPAVLKWKRAMRLRSLPWPASSPDLSLIENVWNIWHQRVQDRCPRTIAEMRRFIREEWEQLSPNLLRNLVSDMPRRCEEVIAAGGDRIRR